MGLFPDFLSELSHIEPIMRYPPCLCIIIIGHCRSYQQNWNTIRLSECWLSCQLDWLSQPLGESKGCHQPFGRHKNGSDAQNLKFETKLNLKFPQQMGIKTFKNSEFTICLGVIPPFTVCILSYGIQWSRSVQVRHQAASSAPPVAS